LVDSSRNHVMQLPKDATDPIEEEPVATPEPEPEVTPDTEESTEQQPETVPDTEPETIEQAGDSVETGE